MIRATLDVNVLASGFQDTPGVPSRLVESWIRGAYELVISDHILDGLSRTLRKPYFRRQMTPNQVDRVFALLRTRALVVAPTVTVHGIGEDEEDDLVLSTALTGAARFLVTGDKYLQQVGVYQDIILLSPRQFLDLLGSE